MTAARPVNRKTQAIGFTTRSVLVDQVIPERGLALVTEISTGHQVDVPLLPLRVRLPAVGERWMLDRTFGNWSFAALLASPDLMEVGRATPFFGPQPPPGDATTWRIGQSWVETPVKYWNGTEWSTTAP